MNIEWLRTFCLSLPGAIEEIKWGNDLCFTIGKKLFCVTGLEADFKFSFKVKDEEFEELSNRNGFVPAPYMARAHWVLVVDPSKLSIKEAQLYIQSSHSLIFEKLTKREKELIDSGKKPVKKKSRPKKK